jgi:transcription elongation factor Elf1
LIWKMAQSGKMTAISIYNDHHVQALLNKFLNGEITTLEPIYSAQTGYHYPVVESILGNSSKVESFLSKLFDAGILERKIFDKTLSCTNCNSQNISFRYCCPFCKSFNIQKSSLVEHVKCGYMDLETKFQQNGKLNCPKCNKELKTIDVDYRKAGVWCTCKECNKSFDIPVPEHFCKNCHDVSTFEEVTINDVYSFSLKANIKAESSLNWFLSSAIAEYLTKEGLTVENSASVKGKSGANHTFDIVAFKDKNSKKIVIDLATAEGSVSEQPVIALFAKIFDVSPDKAFLIAIPKVNENAKKMAELYNIRAIEAKSPDEAIALLKERMKTA